MNDAVALAMRQAARSFAAEDRRTFNAANFSEALARIAGTKGPIDGNVVRAILCGRDDVENLDGGSHFRILEVAP